MSRNLEFKTRTAKETISAMIEELAEECSEMPPELDLSNLSDLSVMDLFVLYYILHECQEELYPNLYDGSTIEELVAGMVKSEPLIAHCIIDWLQTHRREACQKHLVDKFRSIVDRIGLKVFGHHEDEVASYVYEWN